MEAERRFFEEWLAMGYAGTMAYLKRNPYSRTSPQLLHPQAYCALILFAPYYTLPPPHPGPRYGQVARYAVCLDYHDVIPHKLSLLKTLLEERLGRPLLGKYFSDNVELFEPAFARSAGLGFTGKNSMIIGPQLMGSYHFIAELFTDLPLEPDEPYGGTCGKCFRCGSACPTGAIVGDGVVDARLCISYLTIENKGEIPLNLREKLGGWVFGCDICQEVCPYNQRPPVSIWNEFQPHQGVGHFLDLYDVLKISDKKEFLLKFGHTPLSRAKRKGLLRNALVVIGNQKPEDAPQILHDFAVNEPEPILREHAAWALSCYDSGHAQELFDRLYSREPDLHCRSQMMLYRR